MSGAAVAQLIVVDHGMAAGGDVLEGVDIIVGASGAAVDNHQGSAAARQVTGDAVPGLVSAKRRIPLTITVLR